MASKLQRKLIRERRIRGFYARAVWMYYKKRESELCGGDPGDSFDYVSYYNFGFAYMKYMSWYAGVGEKLLFHYPWRGKVRAKDIIVTPK